MSDIRCADGRFTGVPKKYDFSFSLNTTYGCGGTAKVALFPRSETEGTAIFSFLLNSGENFCILGCGSNVLAQDGRFEGYVLSTANMKGITVPEHCRDDVVLNVASGVKVSELLSFCKNEGLTGLEYLAGIPASVGGLVFMNGGAGGKYIADNVVSVRVASPELKELSAEDCEFTYKHSTMRDIKCLILSVKLRTRRSEPRIVATNILKRLEDRRSLPAGRSCGCVFENYCGVSAGKIIENAGLKGVRIGGAYVSPSHANFILNCGRSSSDVYSLIQFVKNEVYKKFGITLKEEVCFIGEFK